MTLSAVQPLGMKFHRPVDDVAPDFAAFVERWDRVSDRPLLDEGVEFAHRLLAAGVPAHLDICHGLPHGFMRAMFESQTAARAVARIAAAIQGGLRI